MLAKIIEKERPDALLPTVGGQTALNLAVASARTARSKYGVELIGASVESIKVAEDRLLFRNAMKEIGADVPESVYVKSMAEAMAAVDHPLPDHHPPVVHDGRRRRSGIAYNIEEFKEIAGRGLDFSPVHEVLRGVGDRLEKYGSR